MTDLSDYPHLYHAKQLLDQAAVILKKEYHQADTEDAKGAIFSAWGYTTDAVEEIEQAAQAEDDQ